MKKCDIVSVTKIRYFGISLITFAMFMLAGCWGSSTTEPKLVVVNVLDSDYHQDCHISGSINIPFELLEERMKTLNKKDRYVLHCSNYACTAAPFAAQLMKDAGFEDVGVFHGGIVEWYQKGYPCQGDAQKAYLKEENEQLGSLDHPGIKNVSAQDLKAAMEQAK